MKQYTNDIIKTIKEFLPKTEQEWELVGFISKSKEVYPFGSDSKIIGRLFEVLLKSCLEKAAKKLGFELFESEKQTVYPDFYFENPETKKKIAIDVKTTYRKSQKTKYSFTAGSFTSFMQNGTKNIVGNYSDYEGHYIIGIVYTREEMPTNTMTDILNITNSVPAYKDVEVFVQEKYRICGEKKGSGNTDNIGTIKANSIKPFEYGAGPFSYLGQEIFHDYWKNHPKYKDSKEIKKERYSDINEYIEWVAKSDEEKGEKIKEQYRVYLEDYSNEDWSEYE